MPCPRQSPNSSHHHFDHPLSSCWRSANCAMHDDAKNQPLYLVLLTSLYIRATWTNVGSWGVVALIHLGSQENSQIRTIDKVLLWSRTQQPSCRSGSVRGVSEGRPSAGLAWIQVKMSNIDSRGEGRPDLLAKDVDFGMVQYCRCPSASLRAFATYTGTVRPVDELAVPHNSDNLKMLFAVN